MDGYEVLGKYDKMSKTRKLDAFESLKNNTITVKEQSKESGFDGRETIVTNRNQYDILQEKDFNEKTWDLNDLLSEQADLRLEEHEQDYLDKDFAHKRAKALAFKYQDLSKKDRRKSFKKYQKVIEEKVAKVTKAYNKRKTGSIKEMIKYEKQIIMLNEEARMHFLTGAMKSNEDLKVQLAKNRMRTYYRLLRMYIVHLNDPRITNKEKKTYFEEMNAIRAKLNEELEAFWKPGQNETGKKFFKWERVTGNKEMKKTRSAKETQKLREQYEHEEEQERIDKLTDEEINAYADQILGKLTEKEQEDKQENKAKGTAVNKAKNKTTQKKGYKFRNNKAAWEKLMRTGIWDPSVKKATDADSENAEKVSNDWHIGRSFDVVKIWLTDPVADGVPDKVFKTALIRLNEQYKKNWKAYVEKMEGKNEAGEKKKGAWFSKLLDDLNKNIDWAEDKKAKTKEEKDRKKEYIKSKKEVLSSFYHLSALDKAYYPEIEELTKELYEEVFHKELTNYAEEGPRFFDWFSHELVNDLPLEGLNKLKRMAARKDFLDSNLKLNERGARIYQTPVIHKLIVDDTVTDAQMEELVKYVKTIDDVIERMVTAKFGPLTRKAITSGVRSFLGEKGLVGGYRQIKDLTQQYLDGLSLTNINAARLDADYRDAYENVFCGNLAIYGEEFEQTIQEYLERSGVGTYMKEKGRAKKIVKMLEPMKKILTAYKDSVKGLSASPQAWDQIHKYVIRVMNNVRGYANISEKVEVPEEYYKNISISIQKYIGKDKRAGKVTHDIWRGKEAVREAKKAKDIEEFNYTSMLKSEDLLESKEIKDIVKDEKMRDFIANHLDYVLLNNKELSEQFPVLKSIESLDQLDDIHYSVFLQIIQALKNNIVTNGEAIKKLLEQGTEKDERIDMMRKQVLLDLMRKKSDGKIVNISTLLKDELARHDNLEAMRRKRLMYKLGRDQMRRSGKILFRFEDMPDRDKGLLQEYLGKGKKWLKNRYNNMEQASNAWKRVEFMGGPAAVEQLKKWMIDCYSTDDQKQIDMKFEAFIKLMTKDDADAAKMFPVDEKLEKEFRDGKGGSGASLREVIRNAVTGTRKDMRSNTSVKMSSEELAAFYGPSQTGVKVDELKNFLTELTLLNTQDILYSHGGKFEGQLFSNYGNEKAYKKMLQIHARIIATSVDKLDKELSKYKSNPQLWEELRDRLLPTWVNTDEIALDNYKYLTNAAKNVAEQKQINQNELEKNDDNIEGYEKNLLNCIISLSNDGVVFPSNDLKDIKKVRAQKLAEFEKDLEEIKKLRAGFEKTTAEYEKSINKLDKKYNDQKQALINETAGENRKKQIDAINKNLQATDEEIVAKKSKYNELKARIDGYDYTKLKYINILTRIDIVINARSQHVQARRYEEIIEGMEKDYDKRDVEVKEQLDLNIEDLVTEYRKNSLKCGYDNLDQISRDIVGYIDKEGKFKGQVFESVQFFEEKKKMLEEYKDGELAEFWEYFIDNDKIFADFSSGDDFMENERLEKLYTLLAPLARAGKEKNAFIVRVFIEKYLDRLLDDKCKDEDILKYREEISELNKKGKVLNSKNEEVDYKKNYWGEKIQQFESNYFEQTKQNTKSILENMNIAAFGVQKEIAKAFYYGNEDVERQFDMRKAKYRKWWFVTSKNTGVELIAQKGGQTKYQVAMANANGVLALMSQCVMGEEEGIMAMSNQETAKQYFGKLRDRFLTNDSAAEIEFLSVYLWNYGKIDINENAKKAVKDKNDAVAVKQATEELIQKYIDEMPEEEKLKCEKMLTEFKMHVRNEAVNSPTEEFSKTVNRYAIEFYENKRVVNETLAQEVEQQKKAYDAKIEKRRGEQGKVLTTKHEGRKLYDELLFGNKQQMLAEFGEKKQTLIYEPEKEKLNKKVKSKGEEEDEKHLDAAKEYFKLTDEEKKEKHEEYPDILAECLDEYCRVNNRYYQRAFRKIDTAIGWFDEKYKTDIQEEADRLKRIYNTVRVEPEEEKDLLPTLEDEIKSKKTKKVKVSIPEAAMDMFLVYAAKYGEKGTTLSEDKINKLANTFLAYYNSLEMINKVNVKHPALKYALIDAIEKDRAYLFALKDEDRSVNDAAVFKLRIEAQIRYFALAEQAYEVLDEVIKNDKYISDLDDAAKHHYVSALREYFTKRILQESDNSIKFDAESYKKQAKELIKDGEARDALTVVGESVSNEDYENHRDYPGELTKKDLEHAIAATRKKDLVKAYNALNEEERDLFALALYCSSQTETGSQRVIYGQTDEMLKEERSQMLSWMKGNEVEFKIDYTRAIRAISVKSKNFKISGDTEKFEAALDFVEKIKKRKDQLRPKDYKRMADTYGVAGYADQLRRKGVGKALKGVTDNKLKIAKLNITDKDGFMDLLTKYSESDKKTQKSQGIFKKLPREYHEFKENSAVDTVLKRVNKLKPGQKSLLIYVLQDRTALDFSTAGKDSETKIVPHANAEKRFEIYEKLMSEEGRLNALIESSSPLMVKKAMKNLLGFQLRDDKELSDGILKEEDFNLSNLYRSTAIDWELLCHALDFLDEMERDKRKTIAVRQAPKHVMNAAMNMTDPEKATEAVKFCSEYIGKIKGANSQEELDELIKAAYLRDKVYMSGTKLNPVNWIKDDAELDDIMGGYRGLTPQQKTLFIRVLQHRDLLDVSQKNLYWNIFGLAERDFVSPKDRDALIDEYIADTMQKDTSFELNGATCEEAILSLLSTQVNDDMSFEKVDGSNWAYKNINVNNQLLVTDQRKATVIDWKLFKRALQFVTRSTNERKMVAGDEALYKHLQGEEKFGKMEFDRKYLRRNLHNTGSSFMRFLAKEGYSEIDGKLGIFKSLADYSEFIVSTKTANYLHEQANKIAIKEAEEAAEEEAENENEENAEQQEEKGSFTFVQGLAKLATGAKDQYNQLKEMKDQVMDSYNEFKDVLIENEEEEKKKEEERAEEEKKDELAKGIKGIDGLPPKTSYLKLVVSYGSKVPELKKSLDDFAGDTEKLEMIDKYIGKYLTEKISVKKLAEWYKPSEDNAEKKDDNSGAFSFLKDENISKELKDKLNGALDFLSDSAEFLEAAGGYLNSAIDVIADFRNIVENSKNILELEATREDAKELKSKDDEKIANAVKEKKLDKDEQDKLKNAQENNVALMDANTTMNKSIQGRKIVNSVAELTKKGLNFAGIETGPLLNKAADLVNFFYKCVSDRESLKTYLKTGAMGQVQQILEGRRRHQIDVNQNLADKYQLKSKDFTKDENGLYKLDNSDLTMIMNASGFERMEEFADYLRLNMVHSLLFSASKFNPLEQPRLIAKTALKILGLEDLINKTDSESAMKIFKKLQQ
ncbi:MAG: hypothetical protein J6W58_09150 [Lachnospiraceae bacterium]|nr:hypothetical protein [Lachnospiraceae bacterium]